MSYDPRFVCPEDGRAPILTPLTWDVVDELRHGKLTPGNAVTCPLGHTWTPPVDWRPGLDIVVRIATPEELDKLQEVGRR